MLLRPFGDSAGRWPAGWPSADDWRRLRKDAQEWTRSDPSAELEVACGLSFLLSDLAPETRRRRLAFGCSGADRFVSMRADGTLWPCSHLGADEHRMGHVLCDDLPGMWARAWQGPPAAELVCPAAARGDRFPRTASC